MTIQQLINNLKEFELDCEVKVFNPYTDEYEPIRDIYQLMGAKICYISAFEFKD